jgi:hypothetical protein
MTNEHEEEPFTLDMIKAGVSAFGRWDSDSEEVEVLVTAIYLSMCAVKPDHAQKRSCEQ